MAAHVHSGRCHCGDVRWTLRSRLAASELPARACTCGFCRVHGALSTSDPAGELRFATAAASLIRYRFTNGTAEFLCCGRCGVYVGALTAADDGRWYGIVNLRTLDGFHAETYAPAAFDYSGESVDERRARRASRWTPAAALGTG